MVEKIKSLPDSELKVMMVIWNNNKEISTGEILSKLKDEVNWKLSTLQIILSRLVDKGFIKSEKIGRFNYYFPLVNPSRYTKIETKNFVKKMYNNSSKKLIAALIKDSNDLTDEDIEEIKKLLENEESK